MAIGFRMNLFNIGVDGQYRLAAFIAAAVGGAVSLPGAAARRCSSSSSRCSSVPLWAGIAGLLKVTRGVSEVISTIMLNFIATGLIALPAAADGSPSRRGLNNVTTKPIARPGRCPAVPRSPVTGADEVFGFIVVAVVVGVGYWFLLGRTRFGFDLRATGQSESAAVASGVNVKQMILVSDADLRGRSRGWWACRSCSAPRYTYARLPGRPRLHRHRHRAAGSQQPDRHRVRRAALGLPGRAANQPRLRVGMPKEIVAIMQGVIVLSVVIAYELVRRYGIAPRAADGSRRELGPTRLRAQEVAA